MSDKEIVVPAEMWDAARRMYAQANSLNGRTDCSDSDRLMYALEAALRWLSENPIVPTMAQMEACRDSGHPCILDGAWYATEWQRRMFLAPKTEIPEAVKDLLLMPIVPPTHSIHDLPDPMYARHDRDVLEAFRRGQEAGSK